MRSWEHPGLSGIPIIIESDAKHIEYVDAGES